MAPKPPKKLSPLEVKMNEFFVRFSRIPMVQKIFFIDHMRTMIHASLSLVEALGILEREIGNKKLQKIVIHIREEVEKGRQLSEVMGEFPKVFPTMYTKMISSGEVAGKLDESLEQVVTQMKKSHELASAIKGAMIYPSVIVGAMGVVGILMTTFVLPKLVEIFNEFDAELPLATRVLIAVTNFLSNPVNLGLTLSCLIGFIVAFAYVLHHNITFQRLVHKLTLHLPIAGPVIKQINLARFSLTLSSLLKSTIPIIDAVDITAETCSNLHYRETLKAATERIKTGIPLSEILSDRSDLYPPMVTEMVMVGERTGEIDHLLTELADFYSKEVDKTMKNFTVIIEPVIILLLGVAVAGVAVAVIMPIYSLTQNF